MTFVVQNTKKIVSGILLYTLILGTIPTYSQQESLEDTQTTKYLYGIASVYNDNFEGQKTASGSKYTDKGLTAAHRSLPFGTRVEVENLSNGKKVEVIIDDRGPFEQNRVLTLSKQSSEILGFGSETTTFVKITIRELGTTLPSPMGVPESTINQDIPQNFTPTPPTPAVVEPEPEYEVEEYDEYNDEEYNIEEDALVDIDDELAFMDDSFNSELTNEDSSLKAQVITNSSVDPIGFNDVQDILIDDPLSNIVISPEDEYMVAEKPDSAVYDSVPENLTEEEDQLLNNSKEDPFADLFNSGSDPYSFHEEVNSSVISPTLPTEPATEANNVGGDNQTDYPPIPASVTQTNFVTVGGDNQTDYPPISSFVTQTNFVTNVVTVTNDVSQSYIPQSHIPMENTQNNVVPQKIKTHFVIQLGAFSRQKNALDLYEKLRANNYNAFITDIKVKGKNLMRVRVGHFNTMEEAIQVSQKLETNEGIENKIIKVELD